MDALLADARRGHAGVLEIVGEPGIGKTALSGYAVAAPGMTVLHALGVQGEARLPLAALDELLRPLRGDVAELAPGQQAVARALFAGGGGAVDRYALGATTLSLLAMAAEKGPLLVVIDDSHWVDELSGAVLSFALRRLGADAVAVVLCRRSGQRRPVDGPWQELTLGGLDAGEAATLLGADVAPSVAVDLHAATGGNPLALRELRRTLTADQLSGRAELPDPLPLGERGTAVFGRRFTELPDATRRALTVVAAAGAGGAGLLGAALTDLGLAPGDLEPAERAGLVVLDGTAPRFPHPLIRAAAFATAAPSVRRQAHHALAVASAGVDVQRHALHLAASTVVASEDVAVALERAAEDAEQRGGPAAGAAARAGAASLSPDGPARDGRRVRAAEAYLLAGRRDDADRLVAEVLATGRSGPDRWRALAVRASLAIWTGGVLAAVPMLQSTIDELADGAPDLAALVGVQLAVILSSVGRLRDVLGIIGPIRALAITDPVIAYLVENRYAAAEVWCGNLQAQDEAERRYPRAVHGPAARRRFPMHDQLTAQTWTLAERFGLAHAAVEEDLAAARRSAAPAMLPMPLMLRADLFLHIGDLVRVRADLDEALDLGVQVGFGGLIGYTHALRARVAAMEGDEPASRLHADEALSASRIAGQRPVELYRNLALGLLDLGAGRHAAAAEHLGANVPLRELGGLANPVAIPWQADHIEALHGAGRLDEARDALSVLEGTATRIGSRWARSTGRRCRALLGDDAWPELYAAALAEQDDLPFERGRTLLLWGTHLRRTRQIRTARERLAAAAETFGRIGASPWAERARAELRAAGVRSPGSPRAATSPVSSLTGQELRVCLAVADGATNREVAATLFVSPKTVEYHLGRVFTKLGMTNRAQLARLVAGGGLGQTGARAAVNRPPPSPATP